MSWRSSCSACASVMRDPNFKTDVLYTGAQPVVQGEFLEDSAVRKLAGMFPPAQRKQNEALFTQII